MSRGKQSFKQTDVTRAMKAAQNAGFDVQGVEIEPSTGKFRVLTKRPDQPRLDEPVNEWDDVR
ncbi:hypothetical protein [Bradyrhizobium sp. ARR65]|uniref:hypothetical protein n=1 Tax=Bradyrhizobium sp. ARR65 TaxID=1040989 RepID=UPI000464A009|nr:hypothetical protein [Bradyrhizobium sp. ARR65]